MANFTQYSNNFFLVYEKPLYFLGPHPTVLIHISNEYENIQNIWFVGYVASLFSVRK